MRKVNHIKRGYTLIEVLISITILIFVSPMFISLITYIQKYPNHSVERQNHIGIIQLRRMLSLGIDITLNENEVCMIYNDTNMCFEEYDSNLIATPGTQYFLISVSNILFEIKDEWLVINFDHNNQIYQVKLVRI